MRCRLVDEPSGICPAIPRLSIKNVQECLSDFARFARNHEHAAWREGATRVMSSFRLSRPGAFHQHFTLIIVGIFPIAHPMPHIPEPQGPPPPPQPNEGGAWQTGKALAGRPVRAAAGTLNAFFTSILPQLGHRATSRSERIRVSNVWEQGSH